VPHRNANCVFLGRGVAQAAERLKSIHASEQGLASAAPQAVRPAAGPGYLAPTQAFAVKSSAAGKTLKSKVDAGSYDPR
jgi:hypothetical protein